MLGTKLSTANHGDTFSSEYNKKLNRFIIDLFYPICWLYTRACKGVSVLLAPWPLMHDPIKSLLNAEEAEANILTAKWRDSKLAELNYIGITSALVASSVVGAFSWFSAPSDPWTTRASWSSALLFALTSISLATQQSIGLHRFNSHENSLPEIRRLLGEKNPWYGNDNAQRGYVGSSGKIAKHKMRMRRSQLWLWQTPVMLSNFAILLFVVGLLAKVFNAAVVSKGDWKTGDIQVAIFFGCASIFAGSNYLIGWLCLNRRSLR